MSEEERHVRGLDRVDASEIDASEIDASEIDASEIDAGKIDASEIDAPEIDVPGIVMRVRRVCDLSQRDLGVALGIDQSQVARIESSRRRVDPLLLAQILALAGMRIAVLDRDGVEVVPVSKDVLRDNADRRIPAHLDVREPSDAPRSALLKPHTGRASPRGWYHHRAMRDRRRNAGEVHDTEDQPTLSGVAQRKRELRAERLHGARHRAVTLFEVDCTCLGGCWEGSGCLGDCECRCEP
jgi:transcriptional regulator with XRE-family HTH domain